MSYIKLTLSDHGLQSKAFLNRPNSNERTQCIEKVNFSKVKANTTFCEEAISGDIAQIRERKQK